jgi:hypothetical protein
MCVAARRVSETALARALLYAGRLGSAERCDNGVRIGHDRHVLEREVN